MSSTKYIEIDSTFRNRNKWSHPSQFEINVSQSGSKNKNEALDPVSNSSNIKRWISNTFNTTGPSSIVAGTVSSISTPGLGAAGDNNIIIELVANAGNTYQQISNYYKNSIAYDTTMPTSGGVRISKYTYMGVDNTGLDRVQIELHDIQNHSIQSGDVIEIRDSTDITNPSSPFFFIPYGRTGYNSYCHHILYNETLSISTIIPQYRKIKKYDTSTSLLSVDTTGVVTNKSGVVTGWLPTHTYSIRKEAPIIGQLNNNIVSTNTCSFPLTFHNFQDAYKNSFIHMLTGLSSGDIRRINKYETYSDIALSGTNTTIILSQLASNIPNYYNNLYVHITSGLSSGDIRRVISYTVTGTHPNFIKTITVNTPFTAPISSGDSFSFRTGIVDTSFTSSVNAGDIFELLQYSRDNYNPLSFNGSHLYNQNSSCYNIELLNLILPNTIIDTILGNRITFYPYLYVELSNRESSVSSNNLIYSNNPHACKMTFRVPIDDVGRLDQTSYIKIDGDGMVHSMKFKPTDTLFFSVYMQDGTLFKTTQVETFGPLPPNMDMQISALFSIKKQ
jgi:hypothetical protein